MWWKYLQTQLVWSGLCGYRMQLRPGSCLTNNVHSASYCSDNMCSWFSHGCPSEYGWLSLVESPFYWIALAPETEPVPWTINSEIYLLQDRGVCGGRVATANGVSNFIIALTFLSLTPTFGTSVAFFLFSCIDIVAFPFALVFVPETNGLSFQDPFQRWRQCRKHKLNDRAGCHFWGRLILQEYSKVSSD
jgi:SP family myo-inositol transporter-like MFS transporter 13